MGGRVHVVIESLSTFAPAISSGKLKALAVATAQRLKTAPDLPAVAETLPGFLAMGWFALMAPPGTPEPIARKVSADLRTVLARPAGGRAAHRARDLPRADVAGRARELHSQPAAGLEAGADRDRRKTPK